MIHSNLQDAGNDPLTPPSNVQWAQDTSASGTGSPQGTMNEDYHFFCTVGAPVGGVTNLEMLLSQGGQPSITSTVQITVGAGGPDHFAPTADAPTTP